MEPRTEIGLTRPRLRRIGPLRLVDTGAVDNARHAISGKGVGGCRVIGVRILVIVALVGREVGHMVSAGIFSQQIQAQVFSTIGARCPRVQATGSKLSVNDSAIYREARPIAVVDGDGANVGKRLSAHAHIVGVEGRGIEALNELQLGSRVVGAPVDGVIAVGVQVIGRVVVRILPYLLIVAIALDAIAVVLAEIKSIGAERLVADLQAIVALGTAPTVARAPVVVVGVGGPSELREALARSVSRVVVAHARVGIEVHLRHEQLAVIVAARTIVVAVIG